MDISAEVLPRCQFVLVFLQERSAGETDKHHVLAHDALHGAVEYAALGAMALVDKHIEVALCLEVLW